MIRRNPQVELDTATAELETVAKEQNITPEKIDKNSYLYKLAQFFYWKYENEHHEHLITKQEQQSAEQSLEEYANAYNALDRKGLTAQKIADQMVDGIMSAVTSITDITKPSKLSGMFKITYPFVFLFLGGILIWQLATNPQFVTAVTNPLVLGFGIITIIVLYLLKDRL